MSCRRATPWRIETSSTCDCAACTKELALWRQAHWLEAEVAADTAAHTRNMRRRKIKEAMLAQTGGRCAICGNRTSMDLPPTHPAYATIDHIRPRSRGGEDNLSNWQIACLRCNQEKGDKWEETG